MLAMYGFSELTCTPLYPKYLEFRHQVFNKVLKYNESGNPVFSLKAYQTESAYAAETPFEIEYDDYDIPKTLHLALVQVFRPNGHQRMPEALGSRGNMAKSKILGCLRFLPTDGPYMIKDNILCGGWKDAFHLIKRLPNQADIYEASRIAVAPYLRDDDRLRRIVLDNLVYANVEIAVRLGISKMVGIMYHRVWESVYRNRGVPVNYVSDPFHVDNGPPIIIGEIDVSEAVLAGLKRRFADELEQQIIQAPFIDPGTLLMHYHHIQKALPEAHPISSVDETRYAMSG